MFLPGRGRAYEKRCNDFVVVCWLCPNNRIVDVLYIFLDKTICRKYLKNRKSDVHIFFTRGLEETNLKIKSAIERQQVRDRENAENAHMVAEKRI